MLAMWWTSRPATSRSASCAPRSPFEGSLVLVAQRLALTRSSQHAGARHRELPLAVGNGLSPFGDRRLDRHADLLDAFGLSGEGGELRLVEEREHAGGERSTTLMAIGSGHCDQALGRLARGDAELLLEG